MTEFPLSPIESEELAAAVFAPWPVSRWDIRRYGDEERALAQIGDEPQWDRALITSVRARNQTSGTVTLRVGADTRGPNRGVPAIVDAVIDRAYESLNVADAVIALVAERASSSISVRTFTGAQALFHGHFVGPEHEEAQALLFGETVVVDAAWHPVHIEHRHLLGCIVRESSTGERFIVADDRPRVTRDLSVVADGTDDAPVAMTIDRLEIRETAPTRHAGAMRQDLAGVWRLTHGRHVEVETDEQADFTAWLDGRDDPDAAVRRTSGDGPTPITARIELTIRPDGSFFEVSDGTSTNAVDFFDDEGVLVELGVAFHGCLTTHGGRDYLLTHDGPAWDSVARGDDPEIVEEVVRTGDQLTRVQNVVIDGLYRERITLTYERIGAAAPSSRSAFAGH
ncbi:hypothetical protein HH308_09935 [Gordonia sp. TBRC 11910]|uniref:Uncharacterized protein n=1 Tax=Gordonia asplenii TaxID=2725283 RepID=A0A848KZC1_9ACTN|nr:hypothetical protein [Gordonia asplenii]NMO01531.1 hypothetical protein [Gordonia asplenii]